MWIPRLARSSHLAALENARVASLECSRRLVEAAEVARFIEGLRHGDQVARDQAPSATG